MQKGRICTRESNDVGKRVDFAHPVAAANTWRTQRPRGASGFREQHNIAKKSDRSATRASSDAGPELASREGHAAMESPQALIAPLERGSGGLKRNARSVRVWGSAPIQKKESPQTNV